MVSSASATGLMAAAALAVFAVLVMSSQGLPRKKPLCSDCSSLCNTSCTAIAAANCSSYCSTFPWEQCKSQVLQACCQSVCSSSTGTSNISCCPSDCMGGDCQTCSCDNCNTAVQNVCSDASNLRCQSSQNGIGQDCLSPCISDCNDHCTKKDF